MRPSDLLRAESDLGAGSQLAARDRTLSDDPAPGLDEPEAGRGLAGRLARLPAAHPSARPDTARTEAVWSAADSQPGGHQASGDAWWRGESEIWWRAGDRSAGEADYDDVSGLGEPSELADADDLSDAGGPGEPGGPDEADAAGEIDDQGGAAGGPPARAARPAAGPAGRDQGRRDGHWSEAGGPSAGPDHGSYRPWFSPDVSGDPWFAAGREYRAGS